MEEKYYKLALYIGSRFRHQREDLVGEALLGLVVACKRAREREFESEEHERNYVAKTISGYCLNYIRKEKVMAPLTMPPQIAAPQTAPDLSFLDPEEQELVKLRLEGFTFREIAEKWGTNHVSLIRKMKKVRKKYEID